MLPVYVIHLPNPERKQRIAAELNKAGFTDITYVHAKEPCPGFHMSNMRRNPRGEFGCSLSHVKALLRAYHDWQPDITPSVALIVEDDISFTGDPKIIGRHVATVERRYWEQPSDEFPDWAVIYLGGHPRGPAQDMGDGLYKVAAFSCAEAYAVNLSEVPYIVDYWLDHVGQKNAMWDFILSDYCKHESEAFAVYPTIAHQPPGWSHIGQKHDDKSHLYEKGWRENIVA